MTILHYPHVRNQTANPVRGELFVYSGYNDAFPLSVELQVHSSFTFPELRSWLVNQSKLQINKEFEARLNVQINGYNNGESLGLCDQLTLDDLRTLSTFKLKVFHHPPG